MADGKLPEDLGQPAVIEISLTSLVAGTKYRAEFEERLEAVVREAFDEGTLTNAQGKKCDFQESVHFKPLGMGTAREVLGKLMEDYNKQLENVAVRRREVDTGGGTPLERPGARRTSHVRVELTASAEALLRHNFTVGQPIRIVATNGKIRTKVLNGSRIPESRADLLGHSLLSAVRITAFVSLCRIRARLGKFGGGSAKQHGG